MSRLLHFVTLAVLFTMSIIQASATYAASEDRLELDLQHEFSLFTKQYKKQYATPAETFERFNTFKSTYRRIKDHNDTPNKSYRLAMNSFGDRTPTEISNIFSTPTFSESPLESSITAFPTPSCPHALSLLTSSLPETVDWRDTLPPARDQGVCSAGYALAATAAVESQLFRAMGRSKGEDVLKLSEQQIVDCDPKSRKCAGGSPMHALSYLQASNGHISFKDYPYVLRLYLSLDFRNDILFVPCLTRL